MVSCMVDWYMSIFLLDKAGRMNTINALFSASVKKKITPLFKANLPLVFMESWQLTINCPYLALYLEAERCLFYLKCIIFFAGKLHCVCVCV